MLPGQLSLYWKLSYAYLGGFSNWVVRLHFFDYIILLFLALTRLQTKIALLLAIEVSSVLSFAFFSLSPGSPVSAKHSKNGECSCSHGLLVFISHTRLSKELFVFLPFLSSGANIARRRIANKDTGDRGKVFAFVICVVYRTPGFSVSKRISKNEASSYFFFRHLPFANCVGRFSKRSL